MLLKKHSKYKKNTVIYSSVYDCVLVCKRMYAYIVGIHMRLYASASFLPNSNKPSNLK